MKKTEKLNIANPWLKLQSSETKILHQDRDKIRLSRNENPLGGAERLQELISNVDTIELERYPDDAYPDLTKELSEQLKISNDRILLGNGSSDILNLISRAFLSPERRAIVSTYSFELFALVASAAGAEVIRVNSFNFEHDIDSISKHAIAKNPGVIFLDNPCNPTGTYIPRSRLIDLFRKVGNRSLIVIDEAYYEYVNREDYTSCIELIDEFPNILVVRTFSKAYGLAGLRLGFCIASPEIIQILNQVRPPFNLSSMSVSLAIAALKDSSFVEASCKLVSSEKKRMLKRLRSCNINVIESAANFIFIELGSAQSAIEAALINNGIIIRSFHEFPGYVRTTIGLPEQNSQLLEIIERYLIETNDA